jgi:hypothetical protein
LIIEGKDWWTEKVTKNIGGNVVVNAFQKQQKLLMVIDK